MKGFDAKFRDFPDYIIGITREIWEQRGIATLHDYYAPDIPVRSPGSLVLGNQGVIAATMATLAEFPDRELLGEDVIWSGTPETGMLSSHRIISTATHANAGVYGAPTGAKLKYRIIADCHAINNQINDEWLIRDQGAIVRQLGLDPRNYARDLIAAEGGPETAVKPFTPAIDVAGPYSGKGNDDPWGARYADILTRLMNADFTTIEAEYDRAVSLECPGGVEALSHCGVDEFWMGLRASFPSAEFKIEHQIGREDPMMPPRAALRWSLHGKHDGWGSFGTPTGAVGGTPKLRREWVLFDETAIWKQILLKTGDL